MTRDLHPRKGEHHLGAVVALAVLLMAGCSSDPTPTASDLQPWEPDSSSSSPPAEVKQQLPLQQYYLMGRDRETVMRAHTVLTQKCMDEQGFTVRIPPPVPETGPGVDLAYRRYGLDSLEVAKKYGYRLPADPPAVVEARRANDEYDSNLTEVEREAIAGAPAEDGSRHRNGCLGKADLQLMEGTKSVPIAGLVAARFVREVNVNPRATDSAATKSAMKEFAACMAESGYPSVKDPRDVPIGVATDVTPSAAEIAAAVTQIGCIESSGVAKAMRTAEIAFQQRAIEANPEAFAEVKRDLDAIVRHATQVLADG